jgi:predicted ribosome quality control (RQC) complex YloA/Tae2 family protein
VKRGMTSISVTDWFDPELKSLEVPLDPTKDGKENMERLFQRHRKALRGAEIAMERLIDAEDRRARLEALIEERAEGSFDELRLALRAEGLLKERAQRAQESKGPRVPYRVFWSARGEQIWVGRGGQDNHATSFQYARGQDLWMHTRDAPGAHVIIPLPRRGHSPHIETLRDAAALAVHHSPLRGERGVELYFTERKHIRPIPGAPAGKVMVSASKTFTAIEVEERITRLYEEAKRRGPVS